MQNHFESLLLPFLLPFLIMGCQSIPKRFHKVNIPESVSSKFASCEKKYGSGQLTLPSSLSAKVEWQKQGRFKAYAVNDFDVEIVSVDVGRHDINIQSSLDVDHLEVKDYFIFYGGDYTGISMQEVSCFLSGKIPLQWLEHVYESKKIKNTYVYKAYDKDRYITINLFDSGISCATVEWRHYMGLVKLNYQICLDKNYMRLFFDEKQLKWKGDL